jgi:hypothetical protein
MKSGYMLTYRGQDYSFGVGDLIVRVGRFYPNGQYLPYGNLELYMHTQSREMRLLGRQPFLLVDFNYHNLDYESPGEQVQLDFDAATKQAFEHRKNKVRLFLESYWNQIIRS